MFYSSMGALKLLNSFTPVEIILIEDITDLELITFNLSPSRKGEKVKVPLWLAHYLESKGFASIDSGSENEWLGRIHWREKVKPPVETLSLSTLPDNFYARSSNLLHALTRFSEDHTIRQKMRQGENLYRDILNRRIRIISEMSLQQIDEPSLLGRLTLEERTLLNLLKRILARWREEVGEPHLVSR